MEDEIYQIKKNWEKLGIELKGIMDSVNRIFGILNEIIPAEDKIVVNATEAMKKSTDAMNELLGAIKRHQDGF